MARCLPSSFYFVRRRQKSNDTASDANVEERTLDGTVDLYGRPASKRSSGSWKGGSHILAELLLSNIAFAGVANNLFIYLTTIMHESTSTASRNVGNWYGTGYIAPMISAFIADSYTGRFFGTLGAGAISVLGAVMVTVSGSLSYFRPPQCATNDFSCPHASWGQNAFLYAGLYVIDFGQGGLLGTAIAFGADQFDEDDCEEKLEKSSFFNWNYQTILGASFVGSTFFVFIEDNVSVGLGWGIAAASQVLAILIFLVGVRRYRYRYPGGNPLPRIAQVIVASVRKRKLKMVDVSLLYDVSEKGFENLSCRKIQHTNQFRFLDKAALMTQKDKDVSPQSKSWLLCTVTQVEEVKYFLRVLPIFITTIMYTTCYSQLTTLFIEQAYTMDRQLGSYRIPAPTIGVFESLSVLFWVVVYDRLIVPFLRKRTGNQRGISELQRIGIGLALAIASITCAAVVEIRRLHTARVRGLLDDTITPVPMSVFWEVPQYFVMGASEVCAYIGSMEFFYDQAPDSLRSLGTSIAMLNIALGYFLSTFLLTVVGRITRHGGRPGWIADNLNRGRVDLFYWLLALMSVVNLLAFTVCAWRYQYVTTQEPSVNLVDGERRLDEGNHSQDHQNEHDGVKRVDCEN